MYGWCDIIRGMQEGIPVDARSGVIAEIQGIMAEIAPTGAVDSEMVALQQLLEGVGNGSLEPQEALREARALQQSRSDYH